jgi:sugar phosphate isomerase/epimerase
MGCSNGMKIGVFDAAFGHLSFGAFLDFAASVGAESVEIATGAYVGAPHCDAESLLADAAARRAWSAEIATRGLTVSAFSCHGNPLHPDPALAHAHRRDWERTKQLAETFEVPVVITFSGLPGGGPEDRVPNWQVCSWPTDHPAALEWQWNERALPYWKAEEQDLVRRGIQVGIEMHAGFLVHSPATALRLLRECGPAIGINFDPSHLFWQGIDPAAAARHLKDRIVHAHAKDCVMNATNMPLIGVLDTGNHAEEPSRAWVFRTPGRGHGAPTWLALAEALEASGYGGPLSLEHEDPLTDPETGTAEGAAFLRSALASLKHAA